MSFNVLIVDDSFSMRAVIKKVVTMSGFEVDRCFEASDGTEALSVMAGQWVDLVITDINMPRMNGIELLAKMKEDDLLRMIPVAVVSTEGNEERVREAFSFGARGYLKKPFLPEECRTVLCEIVGIEEDGGYAADDEDAGDLDF
ncbi:MAG: two-component system response regulator [delta proteobacterium MLS_D]|jgi:two-component system, chemotaxis family, chemotaxis protein CheY|nr:MAG: two-component system response regulator [delta proteobacterium MLS_D]